MSDVFTLWLLHIHQGQPVSAWACAAEWRFWAAQTKGEWHINVLVIREMCGSAYTRNVTSSLKLSQYAGLPVLRD